MKQHMLLLHKRNCSNVHTYFIPPFSLSLAQATASSQSSGESTGQDESHCISHTSQDPCCAATPALCQRASLWHHAGAHGRWDSKCNIFQSYSKTWGSKIISIIGSIKSLQLIESLAEINFSVIDTLNSAISFYFCSSPSTFFSF